MRDLGDTRLQTWSKIDFRLSGKKFYKIYPLRWGAETRRVNSRGPELVTLRISGPQLLILRRSDRSKKDHFFAKVVSLESYGPCRKCRFRPVVL